ncbi:type VI secretion system baseplate subunit TssF [Pseudomonas putida]|uniref:type VI secretion system baseplate subunit TssF n=1 Tax=Pseudomonas putida TaxID=303 RepID=UPI00236391CB|nr:type VI secretion system baseplate subunit TssF [Pseudomonas putida]MDD1969109.1 type VI secretion system baseplate subunit TssF [Pseudomonas putida]
MDDLLPYYERELAFLRSYATQFAERYPKIAGRLSLAGDVSEDPHVERMIQSFALMGSRISKKIEDDYPEFTEALLEVLYPHYLRPFPSCSIVQFDIAGATSEWSNCERVPRGTQLTSRSVKSQECQFRTVYEVQLTPLRVAEAHFKAVAEVPRYVQLPPRASGQISIEFELMSSHASIGELGIHQLRFFTDGEPSFCAALRDVLALKLCQAYLEGAGGDRWQSLDGLPLQAAGFSPQEALIDWPARAHPAYRLLTEFFAFPEKFGFFDCDLRGAARLGRRFTLHLIVQDIAADSPTARLLNGLTRNNLRLHCTPVVNLFSIPGKPITVSHKQTTYSVIVDGRDASSFEVHSIDRVVRTYESGRNHAGSEIRPFYSLHHGETVDSNGVYWVSNLDEGLAERSPGHELQLTIVDTRFDPVSPGTSSLSLSLTCSNRDLPKTLAYGVGGGDLTVDGGCATQSVGLLRKPSSPLRFSRDRGAHWRLISHLSLNHLSLVEGGAEALRELLKLYDLQRSAISARHIAGIVELTHRPATAWLPGKYFASVARGTEIRLVIDEESFVGIGLHIFAQVIDHFFGLYVHANSFTQLVLVSMRSGEEILRCLPRNGDSILV